MMQATNVTAHEKGGSDCQQSLISELVWGKAPKTKSKPNLRNGASHRNQIQMLQTSLSMSLCDHLSSRSGASFH